MQEQISQVKQKGFPPDTLLRALAIVNIFETGKPFGEFAACVVLNDGAGISYGVSQFTHRSGSLLAVVERYLESGSQVGRSVIENALPMLRRTDTGVIRTAAANEVLKKALRAAGVTREMREAQLHVAFTRYLRPAMDACEGSDFVLPLSLAVIYDSVIHGSFEKVRDRVRTPKGVTHTQEKAWITEYVRKRDAWLASIPRLNSTRYRTRFFLNQIMLGRWDLELPLNVNGFSLREQHINNLTEFADGLLLLDKPPAIAGGTDLAIGPDISSLQTNPLDEHPPSPASVPANKPQARSPIEILNTAVTRFDQADRIVTTVITRSDRAKALWTTVIGTAWQTLWAVFGFLAGIPREVWFVVAIIAAALMLAYLYRQLELGKIRETK